MSYNGYPDQDAFHAALRARNGAYAKAREEGMRDNPEGWTHADCDHASGICTGPSVADFERIGAEAFANGEMGAPALNAEVQAALAGVPVGGGGYEIMAAFSRGWNAANMAAPVDLD